MNPAPADAGLLREIVAAMRDGAINRHAAYVDVIANRVVRLGDAVAGGGLTMRQIAAEPQRYRRIPDRSQIESREHIESFLCDYAHADPATYAEAEDALDLVSTPSQWRGFLGSSHPVVVAFDAYIEDFHATIARLLLSAPVQHRHHTPHRHAPMAAQACSA